MYSFWLVKSVYCRDLQYVLLFCLYSFSRDLIHHPSVSGGTREAGQNAKGLVMLWFPTASQPVNKYCRLVLIFHGESQHDSASLWRQGGELGCHRVDVRQPLNTEERFPIRGSIYRLRPWGHTQQISERQTLSWVVVVQTEIKLQKKKDVFRSCLRLWWSNRLFLRETRLCCLPPK